MSAENNLTLIELFKILTPSEVARLTETASRKSSNSVSAIKYIENSLNSEGVVDVRKVTKSAKIIPLESKLKSNQSQNEIFNDLTEEDISNKEINLFLEEKQNAEVIEIKTKNTFVEKKIAVGDVVDIEGATDVKLSIDQQRLESIGIASQNKVEELEKLKAEQELKSMPSASVFLLEERNKIKKSQKKLYNQKAINTYKNSSNMDLSTTEADDESDEKSVGSVGVLINKRQY